MANERIEALNDHFENNPSMDSEYDNIGKRPAGVLRYPSHRSGFVGDGTESDISSNAPDSPWQQRTPPPWKPPETNSNWYRHQPYLQESPMPRGGASTRTSVSRGPSMAMLDEEDITLPANIPLPAGSESPRKELSPDPYVPSTRHTSPEKPAVASDRKEESGESNREGLSNYIRFSVRADVQQRTEPLEQAVSFLRNSYQRVTSSRKRTMLTTFGTLLLSILLRFLFATPTAAPRPDLIKVANFARSFEPLVHFSENGVRQLGDLQETGTAVWDLSESVRVANLTSSPIIVTELEALVDSLKSLATELTGFFASVDGDFDNILLVMDWARRELVQVSHQPANSFSSVASNLHGGLTKLGLLSATDPTALSNYIFASVFGLPGPERARMALQHTFVELLSTLEESIASELKHAQALFSLYAAIDQQFLNLQRATVREADAQETAEGEVLASLWQRALGARAGKLRKFERNRKLLAAVRARTLLNKNMLLEHNGRLVALKQNLEMLRRRLVSPLLRVDENATGMRIAGSGLGLEEQIKGLEETGEHLKRVRAEQKAKVMDVLYGSGAGGRTKGRMEIGDS